jgi:3-oxoacyl-[acyl-carrier-protein] synthase II
MKVTAYINGTSCISPQNTTEDNWFFNDIKIPDGDYYNAIEPSYKDHIAPNLLRRMGRAIKMGVTSANLAIKEANIDNVEGIITGTGLGCFEDSERFLLAILNNDEQFLTPTSFIQSTHNTVGSQIALIMKCYDYNFTYVHRGFSFESTIQDALMHFAEGKKTLLIGGIEEHTPNFVELNRRAKKFKLFDSSVPYWNSSTKGIQMSEGAAFFVLSKDKNEKSLASISGIQTIYKPKNSDELLNKLNAFLIHQNLKLSDIDVTLMGFCSDVNFDKTLSGILPIIESHSCAAYFKHLCGEYHTASAFATWIAAKIITKQNLPDILKISSKSPERIKNVLIINQYLGINYSFILLNQC